eukprot:CAMPEP_0119149338 /NCGR_PEP_ID=MMETSP1310-20130426/43188_1 /TAXON_ID=464262 /ORGANISM="Genus nov. species nov., Strain RCC2339" /LENGTH=53 /DNA_ID=CAMNT_0007141441 /DNA_START=33 /DNA_END=190 /DNA_ORIENTATION=-
MSKLLYPFLKGYLERYLEGFGSEKAALSLWDGNLKVKDVKLRVEAWNAHLVAG